MAQYNDQSAYPVKADPTGADTTLGVDEADVGRPVVTFLNSGILAVHTDPAKGGIDHGQIATNTSDIATNAGNITALDGRLTTAEGSISTNAGNISTNSSDITALQGTAPTANQKAALDGANPALTGVNPAVSQSTTDGLDIRLTTAEGNISTNTSNIASNTSSIGTNASNITALQGTAPTADQKAALDGSSQPLTAGNPVANDADVKACPGISAQDTLSGRMEIAVVPNGGMPATPLINTIYFELA